MTFGGTWWRSLRKTHRNRRVLLAAALVVHAACARAWPEPPPVDDAAYAAAYAQWRDGQRETAVEAVEILGVWSLSDGETAFGSDQSLPITLPASAPARAGVFRRQGGNITLVPAADARLRMTDGPAVEQPRLLDGVLALDTLRFIVDGLGPASSMRYFLTVWDEARPAALRVQAVETFPVDRRWRVAARFDALDRPTTVSVPDVRGGTIDVTAVGQLVLRIAGGEHRLTALNPSEQEPFWVMFKDTTNGSSTFGGYRVVWVPRVRDRDWTVVDFNMAGNPPCAYSPHTLCPLPPRENTLSVAVEAGEKRFAE
jgi:uncharacterized protein (DUF1684 family)